MNSENHVTSLEISKKLFELGIPQQSVWGLHWVLSEWGRDAEGNTYTNRMTLTHDVIGSHSDCKYKALLASEIMDLLPDRIIIPGKAPFDCFRFNLTRSLVVEDGIQICPTFIVNYHCDTSQLPEFFVKQLFGNIWAKTLPDALAKTLIYLKEHKLDELPYIPEIFGGINHD